jgi:hypothetical protein
MAVDPLTSENKIVTTRRSPASFRRGDGVSPKLLICIRLFIHLLEPHLVYIAPHPILTHFKGLDDWMASFFKMFRSVLILRIVAATDMAAGQA